MLVLARVFLSCALISIGAIILRLPSAAQVEDTNALEQRAKDYEKACVATLRVINAAQGAYQGGDPKKGFARSLKQLGPQGEGMLAASVVSSTKEGYRFRLIPERAPKDQPIRHYLLIARPIKYLTRDQSSFFTDETGIIRSTTAKRAATGADRPID